MCKSWTLVVGLVVVGVVKLRLENCVRVKKNPKNFWYDVFQLNQIFCYC